MSKDWKGDQKSIYVTLGASNHSEGDRQEDDFYATQASTVDALIDKLEEYGIDLKTISRTIDSDKLATKVIVNPNSNEFAPNGFCSIARSNWNYSKENFILNLDYYTQ